MQDTPDYRGVYPGALEQLNFAANVYFLADVLEHRLPGFAIELWKRMEAGAWERCECGQKCKLENERGLLFFLLGASLLGVYLSKG